MTLTTETPPRPLTTASAVDRLAAGLGADPATVVRAAAAVLLARHLDLDEVTLGFRPPGADRPIAVPPAGPGNPRFADVVRRLGREPAAAVPVRPDLVVEADDGYAVRGTGDGPDPARAAAFADRLDRLLAAAANAPDARVGDLDLLTAAERRRILAEWNATATAYGTENRCIHEVFQDRVREQPDAPAAWHGTEQLTYAQLNTRANQLAAHLRLLGTGPESRVGVLLDRDLRLPVTLMAVLKAGGAYLPLDPAHPDDRLSYLVGDAGCELVVTTTALAGRLPAEAMPICLDDPVIADRLATGPGDDVDGGARPDNLAYVIYTSGSTGAPKGTLVPHRGVVNLMAYWGSAYGFGPGVRSLQFANPTFDVSVSDFFGALGNGATVIQADRLQLLDPRALTGVLRDQRVTAVELTPAVLQLLDPGHLPDLRLVFAGGEAFPAALAARWRTPGRAVYNSYGPTETTVTCTDHRCGDDDDPEATPPIGRPLRNHRAYALDRLGRPVPEGVPGELYIGGVGVSRGYLGRPGLTADRFVPDPYGPPGARLYRTGDVVRWRPDGVLDFLGRADQQIKLHGHRVEPGEVEAALTAHDDVSAAVVDAHTTRGGDRVLVAFLVVAAGRPVPPLGEIHHRLRGILPRVLLPARVVAVPDIPLTPSGKVDRRALHALL